MLKKKSLFFILWILSKNNYLCCRIDERNNMPLVRTFEIDPHTVLYVWTVEEALAKLQQGVSLSPEQQNLFEAIHNEAAKKNFLATRLLLKELGYDATALYYDSYGKPLLKSGNQISISHSFNKVSVIISTKHKVGVDIEKKREKIVRIASKFTQWNYSKAAFSEDTIVQKLTMIWCAKEVGFKIHNTPSLTLNDVKVRDFFPTDKCTEIKINDTFYTVYFKILEEFVLGYCYK